jgi:hypothetical protein
MGSDAHAGAEPQNRPRILGDVGLEQRDLHRAAAREILMKLPE